jgi:hypothetical protein
LDEVIPRSRDSSPTITDGNCTATRSSNTDRILVAHTLEEAARKMLGLGWFDPSGASINWHHFAGTKTTNAETLRNS